MEFYQQTETTVEPFEKNESKDQPCLFIERKLWKHHNRDETKNQLTSDINICKLELYTETAK